MTDARAAENMAGQVGPATGEILTATVVASNRANPVPQRGELAVEYFDGQECGPMALGCWEVDSLVREGTLAGRVLLKRGDSPAPHELGHALFGFCHHSDERVARLSVMGSGGRIAYRLTQADFRAVRAVYGAGLRPGATRAQFVQAGLIDP